MPTILWATSEQLEWLLGRLPGYLEAQKVKKYTDFWATLFEDWFKEWPELAIQFPGKQQNELTTEEHEALSNKIADRMKVCH
jgi:hypothetical protein